MRVRNVLRGGIPQGQHHIAVMVTPDEGHIPTWGTAKKPIGTPPAATPFRAFALRYIPKCEGIIVTMVEEAEEGSSHTIMDLYPKAWVVDHKTVIPKLPIIELPRGHIWYQFEEGVEDERARDLSRTWVRAEKVELPQNYILVLLDKKWRHDCWNGYSVLRADSPHLSHEKPKDDNNNNKGKRAC